MFKNVTKIYIHFMFMHYMFGPNKAIFRQHIMKGSTSLRTLSIVFLRHVFNIINFGIVGCFFLLSFELQPLSAMCLLVWFLSLILGLYYLSVLKCCIFVFTCPIGCAALLFMCIMYWHMFLVQIWCHCSRLNIFIGSVYSAADCIGHVLFGM
jgi:hypothetical protein